MKQLRTYIFMTDTKPNSDTEFEEEATKMAEAEIAKHLGVNPDDNSKGTEEKESDSSKKTDTESTEGNSSGESEKSSEDKGGEETDYKEKYAASTKEFQEKYKPMEDNIKQLEQLSGKSLDDILKDYNKSSEEQIETKDKEKELKDSSGDDEVKEKLSSVEERLGSMEEKVLEQDERNKVSANEKVEAFKSEYGISEEEYSKKYQPLLPGIKEMKKENGDPYTLDEALNISYLVANKGILDKIVEKRIQIRQQEQDMTFSPEGSKQTSSTEKSKFTSEQQEAAKRMGIDLEKSEEGKSS